MLDRAPSPHDDKIYSPQWRAWSDPDIPDTIDPIEALLGRHLGTPAEGKTAIVADGEAVTYRQLMDRIERTAGALTAAGLAPESRMLMFGTDSLDYVCAWFGAIRAGGIPVVVSDLYKQRELLYFLADTGARLLFIDAEQVPKLIEVAGELPASLKTIVVRGEAPDLTRHCPRQTVLALSAALSAAVPSEAHSRHSNDLTYMFYSGGTTGTAK